MTDTLDTIQRVDVPRWRRPPSGTIRGGGASEGSQRLKIVLAVHRAQLSSRNGWAYLSTRHLAVAAGCGPHKAIALVTDLWKRERVLEVVAPAGSRPAGYQVADASIPGNWRAVPWIPGLEPARRYEWSGEDPESPSSPFVARSDPQTARYAKSVARSDPQTARQSESVARSDPLIARESPTSRAIWGSDRATKIHDSAPNGDGIQLPNSLNLSLEAEAERERVDREAEGLAELLRQRRPGSGDFVNGTLTDQLRRMVLDGFDLTRLADGIRYAPKNLGPPAVLQFVAAGGVVPRAHSAYVRPDCDRCGGVGVFEGPDGGYLKCDHSGLGVVS